MQVPLNKALCIIPFSYANEGDAIEHPDKYIHSGLNEALLLRQGGTLMCPDLPSVFEYATEASEQPMHFQTIRDSSGKRYIPMFTSYSALLKIFGLRTRISLICFETAKHFCLTENLDGIVIGPGTINSIINRSELEVNN